MTSMLTEIVGADSGYDALFVKVNALMRYRRSMDRTATATADYDVATDDQLVVLDAAGGAFTVTLPASPVDCEWHAWKVKAVGVFSVTIDGNGHDIDGSPTKDLGAQYGYLEVEYDADAGKWWIVSWIVP